MILQKRQVSREKTNTTSKLETHIYNIHLKLKWLDTSDGLVNIKILKTFF